MVAENWRSVIDRVTSIHIMFWRGLLVLVAVIEAEVAFVLLFHNSLSTLSVRIENASENWNKLRYGKLI